MSAITGITNEMLQSESPLSLVLPEFLHWVVTTTDMVNEETKAPHYPG